jgi:uncharacterized membrane protein YdjX (TVP38/TMEM64 family)
VRRLLPTIAALVLAAVVVAAVDPLRDAVGHAVHGDVHGLRAELRGLGAAGAAVLVGLILIHAVVLFPAEIVNATAGLVYGFALALPLVMLAWLASALLAYWLGVVAGRPLALALAGEERVAMAERVIERGGAPALLVSRLVPFVPYSLVGYLAGAARVPVWRYAWTSFVGILPITAAATYLGQSLGDLSASDPLLWLALAVIALLVAASVRVAHRLRRTNRPR